MVKLNTLLFTLLVSLASICQGQQDIFVNMGMDLGMPINTYQQNKQSLYGVFPSSQINGHLGVQYRVFDRVGIDFGVQQSFQFIQMRDRQFEDRNDDIKARLKSTNFYFTGYGGLSYYIPYGRNSCFYLGGGYAINLVGNGKTNDQGYYNKGKETILMTQSYLGQNSSITAEAGIQTRINGGYNSFYIGLKTAIGIGDMMNGNYTVLDSNFNQVSNDKLYSQGTYVGLTLKYGLNVFHKDRKPRQPKPKPVVDTTATVVAPPPVTPSDSIPSQVDGRKVNVAHVVNVTNAQVTIKVWDHEIVDGDIISLNFDGQWILQNYTLKKEQLTLTVTLQPGVNYLVLHAHNLGRYSPNTAAIIIDDGNSKNKIILESTLDSSGTIEINLGGK